jgi:arginyl-tRNA synthetase
MNPFAHFKDVLDAALAALQADGALPAGVDTSKVVVEPPRDPSHGDITTNAAMVLAKAAGKSPRDIAASLVERLSAHGDVESADIAGPGFVNMRIADSFWPGFIRATLAAGEDFGHSDMDVGHCRGAVFGDALANLLAATGHEVTREYYINDAGSQIDVLAQSAYLRYREALGHDIGEIPAGLYPGDYLVPLGKALAERVWRPVAGHGRKRTRKHSETACD